MKKTAYLEKEVTAFYRINEFLGDIDNLDRLLHQIMQEAAKTVEAQASSVALYDPLKKELYFTVALGTKGSQVKELRVKLGQGIIGYAAQRRKPLNIPDVTQDKRFYSGVDKKTQFKSRAILAVPMLHMRRLVGALEVINKKGGGSFTAEDEKLLEIVAGQAAIAIENAKLYRRLIKKHASLKEKHVRMVAMQKEVLRMERMSAIGDMSSRMVHDLRNPLSVIRGYSEMLKDVSTTLEDRDKFSGIIIDEIDRLTGMTSEVMDFVKGKTTFLLKDYRFDDFIKEIANFLERDFQTKNIKLIVESHCAGMVCMDKFRMQRAIFNITYNAKDILTQGGAFKIETNIVDNQAEIRLSDTGPGIPPEIKNRLGEPFVTFGKAHGTGLGLAIARKVIESHKGTFSVESQYPPQPGAFNTTFILRIPIKQQ